MSFQLTSICKKQIVAVTGLMLIVFIIGHLAGNLFIFGGQEAFNGYADKLKSFGPVLLVIEYALALVFIVHILTTVSLVLENIKARGGLSRYTVDVPREKRSFAARIMPYTGTYILGFLVWHLFDFNFADGEGSRSMIGGQSADIYGIVINAFKDPVHSMLYIIAMCCLGFHLTHGFQSCFQTMGMSNSKFTPFVRRMSAFFGLIIAIGFSSIPIYVLFFLK